ncbi:MAG: hypothetical protein Q7T82_04480 [Armatimonadota bacterium]|nr:hypothetical protein [Armatimonadota bacterium]
MVLIVLLMMTALIVAAVRWRNRGPLFAATLGFLTFMLVPLHLWGPIPLKTEVVAALLASWRLAALSAAIAILVYGGIGLLVDWYVRTSADVRWIRLVFSALVGAIASGLVYNVLMRFLAPGARLTYGGLAHVLGVGALVALVVSFATTHERPADCPFFRSRDGGTVLSAILGAAAVVGGLNIVVQQLPGFYPMRQIVTHTLAGGLLGAGLTIPLRAIASGRLVRAALGALIGSIALSAVLLPSRVGAPPLQGLIAGALVGALLPEEGGEGG